MVIEVETHSVALETEPGDQSHIHSVFRAVHSLKGNSSFFDLTKTQSFCHSFENYLDLVREKKIEITDAAVHFIIEGGDHLKNIFMRLRESGLVEIMEEEEIDFLDRLDEKISLHTEEDVIERIRGVLIRFFNKAKSDGALEDDTPIKDLHEMIQDAAPDLIADRRKSDAGNGVKWMYKELDVTREYMDLLAYASEAAQDNNLHDAYNRFMSCINSLMAKHLSAGVEEPLDVLEDLKDSFDIFYQEEIGVDDTLITGIKDSLDVYAKNLTEVKPEVKQTAQKTGGESREAKGARPQTKTMRINEGLLDEFIDHVGELINVNELFNYLQQRLEAGDLDELSIDFKNANHAFHELSGRLQKSLYEIRKAPVERAISKLPKIVREVSKSSGKLARLQTSGGETEVDKSLMGLIETMFMHCIRNSIDHGIEKPEDRVAAGKNAEGKIMLDVHSDKNQLIIRISDDGQGVDAEKVLKRAIENKLVSAKIGMNLSDADILNYLLLPGFSTAEKVTETSGRGVGMDVVASSIRDMSGDIKLINRPGKGLTIDINLPLAYTTRIKLGLTMRVGDSMFLIPAESVRESFRASEEDVSNVENKGEVVQRWDRIYPLVRLSDLLDIIDATENVSEGICILAEFKGTEVALFADEILGQRQIVYKELTVQTKEPSAFEGISILDGRNMALILSVDGIIKQFQE